MVREALSSDIDDIVRLSVEGFGPSAWSRDTFERLLQASSADHERLAASEFSVRPGRIFTVCSAGNTVQGYLVMEVFGAEAEIQSLAVARAERRRGWGRELLADATERARRADARMLFLEVRSKNEIARAFYRKYGFEEYGRRPRYYHDPVDDAVLMRCWL